MAIFIDSADLKQIERSIQFGWVSGVTTNPLLLRTTPDDTEDLFEQIVRISSGPIFYQLVSTDNRSMQIEAARIQEIVGDRLVLKLLPTIAGYQFCRNNTGNFRCCITAIFSVSQALIAREVNAAFVAVYVDRARRLKNAGPEFLKEMAGILEGSQTRLLAASLKNVDQVVESFLMGAADVTLPYKLLKELILDPVSDQAVDEFLTRGRGIDVHK